MTDVDVRANFEKISDKAKAASDELKDAGHRSRDQLETDVAKARDRATAAADKVEAKAGAARDDASSQWQAVRESWRAHVTKARAGVKSAEDKLDARQAARDADWAEGYAYDAISFALNAIDEAEYATLAAVYARADALERQV
jgi:hypothetical protein